MSRLDRAFAALADPTRRRIVVHLARGEASVFDLVGKKLLQSIEVGDVCFFSRKPAESAASNRAMNKKLLRIHPAPPASVRNAIVGGGRR